VEEVDYEDNEQEKDSEEYSGSEEEEEKFLGDGLGSSSAANNKRKLRLYSEKRPGKILASGYERMHSEHTMTASQERRKLSSPWHRGTCSALLCRRCREGCDTTSTESEPGWVSKEEMRSGPGVTQVITCGRKPTGGGLWENP
jgi:hypothetical protein